MVRSSPACPPQATFAEVMQRISSKSVPLASDSSDSPRSELMSIHNSLISTLLLLPDLFHPLFLRSQCLNRLRKGYFRKSQLVARPQLTDAIHISRDNIGYF